MKRILPLCLAGSLAACQTPKPEIDPTTGEPIVQAVEEAAPPEPEIEVADEPPARKGGFFGLFRSKKGQDDESLADVGEPELPEADEPSVPSEPAPRREVDKSASLEEQFRQAAAGSNGVGRDDWRFSSTELKRVSRGSAASNPGAVDAIADYARSLKKSGVQLIVVPIPPKSLIYADYLSPDWKPGRKKAATLGGDYKAVNANLRARGVSVVDATEILRENRLSKKGRSFPKSSATVSPKSAQLISAVVAEVARTGGWLNDGIKVSGISGTDTTVGLDKSLGGPAETVPARAVRQNGSLIQSSSKAPVLILGDATATAGKSTGTSFADQLAFELRVPVDIQSSTTDGRNVPRTRVLRQSVMSPGYASRKKCVVWIFNAAEFTVRDWRKVPLALEMQESEETLRDADEA